MSNSESCDHDHSHATTASRSHDRARTRTRAIRRVFLITLALNALVAISKAGYGYLTGSVALGTDSVHSILDAASNVLALLGLHWAAAPANPRHPYGHRKVEIVAALGIGVLIVIGLFELGTAAVESLRGGRPAPRVGWPAFAVVLGTMVINFFVSRYEHAKGHELGSQLLCADAHHTQSDLYASAAVLGSFIAVRLGLAWADGLAALLLVVLVGRAAWLVFRDNVPVLIDTATMDPAGVIGLAAGIEGVENVHRVRSRGVPSAMELDMHMQVAREMTVNDAHRLASRIEHELKLKFPELSDVVIHIEPTPDPADSRPDNDQDQTHDPTSRNQHTDAGNPDPHDDAGHRH